MVSGVPGLDNKRGPSGPLAIRCGAACRIRTYDLLIRSQTLYPAELMPQRKGYNRTLPVRRQELSQILFYGTRMVGKGKGI